MGPGRLSSKQRCCCQSSLVAWVCFPSPQKRRAMVPVRCPLTSMHTWWHNCNTPHTHAHTQIWKENLLQMTCRNTCTVNKDRELKVWYPACYASGRHAFWKWGLCGSSPVNMKVCHWKGYWGAREMSPWLWAFVPNSPMAGHNYL